MITAVFPGSFDPVTYGHLNIIERASSIFDKLHVVVAVNKGKNYFFSVEDRVTMLQDLVSQWQNVQVATWDSLIIDYANKHNASVLVRGIRNITDFSYEFDLALMNRTLATKIETVFIPAEPRYFTLSSSAIKELVYFGGNISEMVPPGIESAILNKLKNG